MFGSLRFKLPALFLLGVVLSGLISTAIAIRFFQSYTKTRAIAELRSESVGIVRLYARQAGAQKVPVDNLQAAIGGDRIFYVPVARGVQLFTGTLPTLPRDAIPAENLKGGKPATVNLTVKGKKYIAVVQPLKIINQLFGAMVVAKPVSQLRSRWVTLAERLALAFGGGVIIAGLLGVYLTRRMTDPLMQLSSAADEVAAGNYDVALPEPRGHDEIAQLTGSFGAMTSKLAESEQLSRNFLMSVSHELRTPLTAIRGHVSALSEGVFEDPAARDASLDVIAEEALRLERLVGDVLDLAKLDAHRFTVLQEEVDMAQLCERAFTAFGEEARRRSIDYRSDFRASPVIITDGDRVLQIISNLLSNAFRWTPEGGRVELELGAANGSVTVAVADTGPGIRDDEKDRIFRPFWSRDGSGTGLGLAIASELALALGGKLDVQSDPGRGSRFELVLPGGG